MGIVYTGEEGVQDHPEERPRTGRTIAGGVRHWTVLGVLFELLGPSVLEQEPDGPS